MSLPPRSKNPIWAVLRVAIFSMLALGVITLQIALPRISYRSAGEGHNESGEPYDSSHGNGFWSKRLRFDGLFDPASLVSSSTLFQSSAVYRNELIILLKRHNSESETESFEIVRINLRSGYLTSSPAPEDIRHVLSDGENVWFLPDEKKPSYAHFTQSQFFISGGRPVLLKPYLGVPAQFQLHEFVDGMWRETDQYVLLPRLPSRAFKGQTHFLLDERGNNCVLIYAQSDMSYHPADVYYRVDLATGSEQQASQFSERYVNYRGELTDDELHEIGWSRIRFLNDHDDDDHPHNPFIDRTPFGYWFANDRPCAIGVEVDNQRQRMLGFQCCRSQSDGSSQFATIPSPIRWRHEIGARGDDISGMCVVSSVKGETFIISLDPLDNRLHVLRWNDGYPRIVAQRGSPLIQWVCLDCALLFCVAFMIPTLLLVVIAWCFQRRTDQLVWSTGDQSVVLSGIIRRSLARLIDSCILLGLLVGSLILHPDAMGWWWEFSERLNGIFYSFDDFGFDSIWDTYLGILEASRECVSEVFSAPVLWPLVVAAIVFGISQIVWQGRTGRTVGKCLLGLKVLRTTLRPCGVARSLLREILFVIDTVCLLTPVPGVSAIIGTKRSQRIGDLLADTIVVRQSSSNRKGTIPEIREAHRN